MSSSPGVSWDDPTDSDDDGEHELHDDFGYMISQHDPTQESIGAREPSGPTGTGGDSSGDGPGEERLKAPLSQKPLNLEFKEFGPEQETEEPRALTLPRSESQDPGWGDDTDSEDGFDDDDDEEDAPRSQGGGDAPLYSFEQTKVTLSKPVCEAFEPMLAAGGPSHACKRQRSDAGLYAGALAAAAHDCPAQRQQRAAGGPKLNVACDFHYMTHSKRGHVLKLFCTECKARMVELRVGDVVRVNGNLTLVCSLGPQTKTLHLQKLSTSLRMHTGARCAGVKCPSELRLLAMGEGRGPTFMLTRKHLHLNVAELNTAWTYGKVEWLSRSTADASAIMFCRSSTTNDVESVDLEAVPVSACGCFDPWAAQKGLRLRPGDLVEIVPGKEERRRDGSQALDKRNRLGRFLGWMMKDEDDKENRWPDSGHTGGSGGSGGSGNGSRSVGSGGGGMYASQPMYGSQGKPTHRVAVRLLELHVRGHNDPPETAYAFHSGTIKTMPQSHIIRQLDPEFDLPPGVELVEGDAQDAPSPGKLPPRLLCTDLFAGMGGLSLGLEASGAAVVRWAVDAFRAAVETFRASHPDAQAFCEDVCRFLERLGGQRYPPKWDKHAEEAAARRGDPLTLLVGGPPCQGFSGASKADPATRLKKNICLAVFLEAVRRMMPHYVIIENVKGMLRAEGAVEGVFQVLVSLGYQVRLRVLNAGAYGVAQHRVRTIIMAARHGLPLPQAPAQTHVFKAGGYDAEEHEGPCDPEQRVKCAYAGVPLRWQPCVEVWNCAFLPRISVWDCMWDLPDAEGEGVQYKCCPQRPFQASMRAGVAADAPVRNHVTNVRSLKPETRARLAAVPRGGDPAGPGRIWACADPHHPAQAGDWRDLPFEMLPNELQEKEAWSLRKNWGRIGRPMWSSQFRPMLTKSCVSINSRTAGPVLHPEAARPLTVRETARVQGIPDHVVIHGGLADGYKQCGNGVPPPLAEALGRELRRAEWLRLQRQRS